MAETFNSGFVLALQRLTKGIQRLTKGIQRATLFIRAVAKQEKSDRAASCVFDLADFLSEPGADKAEELLGKWPDWKARLENCGPAVKVLAEELEVTAERVAGALAGALDEHKAKNKGQGGQA